ncbi:MAG: sigma-70 family RNA polymerase sigma factor [bacterium]
MNNDAEKNINLVKNLQSRDKAKSRRAFDEIYRIYSGMILRICSIELKNSYLAEDVFQNTFIQFYESATQAKEIKNIRNMLITIAKNACKNELKRNKAFSLEDVSFEIEDKDYDRNEKSELVDMAIASLDEKYREPLILKEFVGMSYKDICAKLDITEQQLTMRLFRAKKALAKILESILKEL